MTQVPASPLAEAAIRLVGTPFRLHGRNPATGLDCVGLVAEALRQTGTRPYAPEGYRLRNLSIARWLAHAPASGLTPVDEDGDVILARVHPLQPHLAILVPGGFVHAHAGLRRVTFCAGPAPWPIERRWRHCNPE